MVDLVWSHPNSDDGWGINPAGMSYTYIINRRWGSLCADQVPDMSGVRTSQRLGALKTAWRRSCAHSSPWRYGSSVKLPLQAPTPCHPQRRAQRLTRARLTRFYIGLRVASRQHSVDAVQLTQLRAAVREQRRGAAHLRL